MLVGLPREFILIGLELAPGIEVATLFGLRSTEVAGRPLDPTRKPQVDIVPFWLWGKSWRGRRRRRGGDIGLSLQLLEHVEELYDCISRGQTVVDLAT